MPDTPTTPEPGRGLRGMVRWPELRRHVLDRLGWIADPVRPERATAPMATQDVLDVLRAKIIFSHARNRQQLLGPPPTALGHLANEQTELLVCAAVLAARASGPFDDAAERRLRGVLSSVGLQSTDAGFLQRAIEQPLGLDQLLHQVRDAHVVSLVYAASLLGAERHDEAGRAWLHYLALRMKIPTDTLARLHSQFGAAG